MASMLYRTYILIVLTSFCFGNPHTNKESLSKERTADGYHRDSSHYKSGEHNFEFDHESVLGSHNAAEEFDQLTPEESKKRLRILAEKMDKNKDEFVDKIELTEWVLKSFEMLTQEEALDQLEDEDGDNDGRVTWQEHLAEIYNIFDDTAFNSEDIENSEDLKMMQNDKELFQAADLNNDGILDKKEFPAFSHPEEFVHMHEILFKHAMLKRDRNEDGSLSFEEFMNDNYAGETHTSERFAIEKQNFENMHDLDKDGKLDHEEVLQWLIPNNKDAAESEADHLIQNSDENKDGVLSIDEIVDHHEIFVGSEATDFGEHLQNAHKFSDEL